MKNAWERLDDLLDEERDIKVDLQIVTLSCWSCELLVVTNHNDDNIPDEGRTFYSAGAGSAKEALTRVLDAWDLVKHQVEPAQPAWMCDLLNDD